MEPNGAHLAAPGRACLECLGQYDPALVAVERAGLLDDPTYLAGLGDEHPLHRNENVFPFSAATAANETLQLLTAVIRPGGIGDIGGHLYHFTTGTLEHITHGCNPNCPYTTVLTGLGDLHGLDVTDNHPAATAVRTDRRQRQQRPLIRLGRKLDEILWRLV